MTESKNPGITHAETDYCPFMKATISGLSDGETIFTLACNPLLARFDFVSLPKRTLWEGWCLAGADLSVIPP